MSLPSSPLSLDLSCRDFPAGTLSSDVAKWLVDFFALATGHKIVAFQEFPGKRARLTFAVGGEAHVNRFISEGEVTVNGVKCIVVRPAPPPPTYTNVVIFQYPYECDDKWLIKELSAFGKVKDVRCQMWTNIPDCHTGTRIVRMIRTRPIPRFLSVNGIRVKAWFKGQPVACDICRKEGHRAGACPMKGKCFRCHQAGHASRNCPAPPWHAPAAPPAPAPAAEVHPHAGNGAPPLIFADELDQGFESPVGDDTLAEAAGVTEALLNNDSAPSVVGASEGVVVVDNVSVPSGEDAPTIEVVDSGSSPPIMLDERYNQLDEIASQSSISILANCGPAAASSGGELSISQISNVSNVENLSNESSNVGNECESLNNDSVGNVNCYGSVVAPDDSSAGPADSEMSQASGPRKRPISVSSSDESASSSPAVPKSKGGVRKASKKGPASHLPVSVTRAVTMTVPQRSLATKK